MKHFASLPFMACSGLQLCAVLLLLVVEHAAAGSILGWSPGFQYLRWTTSAGGFQEQFPCIPKVPSSGWTDGGIAFKRWTPVIGPGCDNLDNPGVCGYGVALAGSFTDKIENLRVEKSVTLGKCVAKLEAFRNGDSKDNTVWTSGFLVGAVSTLAGNGLVNDDSIRWVAKVKFPSNPKLSGIVYLQDVGDTKKVVQGTRSRPSFRIELAKQKFLEDGSVILACGARYLDIDLEDTSRSRRQPQASAEIPIDVEKFHELELILEASKLILNINGKLAMTTPLPKGSLHMAKKYYPYFPFTNAAGLHFKNVPIEDGTESPSESLGTLEIASVGVFMKTRVYIGSVGFFHAAIAWLLFLVLLALITWSKCSRWRQRRLAKSGKATKASKNAKAIPTAMPANDPAYTNPVANHANFDGPNTPQRRMPHLSDPALGNSDEYLG